MEFVSGYVSHQPDDRGFVSYSDEENNTWRYLYERQMTVLPGRACVEFMTGLARLNLDASNVPQLPDVNVHLKSLTGWEVVPVEALISAREFFELLAQRYFPAATFIRCPEEIDYVQEPDIFHELFGHCPMLTNPVYADFVHQYALKVLTFPEDKWPLLQRLFWFTVEFGLIQTKEGLRAYGGGILSSIVETAYSVESDVPMRVLFDPVVAFRVPYRIDRLQAVYFVIQNFESLFSVIKEDIGQLMGRACELKEFPPFFPIDPDNPSIHILAC